MKRLLVGAPVILALAVGCSGGGTAGAEEPAQPPAEPQTAEAARAVLDQSISRSLAGNHGGTWELLIPEERALISRDQYVEYQTTCNPSEPQEVPYEITDVRLEAPDRAVGTAQVPGASFTMYVYYRDGRWLTTMLEPNRAGAEHWVATQQCL